MINYFLDKIDKLRSKEHFVKSRSFLSDIIFFDFLSVPLTKKLAVFKFITPNGVTIFALVVSLVAIYFYYLGGWNNLAIGAILFYFANLFDGIDGKLARLIDLKSDFGAKLDRYSDSFRKALALVVLTYSQNLDISLWIYLILIVIHYGLNYVPYKTNETHIEHCNSKGVKSIFCPWDAMFLLLVVGPLLNQFLTFLILVIILQIGKIMFHKFLNKQESHL